MKTKFYGLLVVGLGVLFVFLYNRLVFDVKAGLYQKSSMLFVHGTRAQVRYDLPFSEKLFLKIKTPAPARVEDVRFNNAVIFAVDKKDSGDILTRYFYIPEEAVRPGRNIIRMTFSGSPAAGVDVRLSNYVRQGGSNWAVLFPEHRLLRHGKKMFLIPVMIFPVMILLLRLIYAQVFVYIPADKLLKYMAAALLPAGAMLSLVYYLAAAQGYRIALGRGYFTGWLAGLIAAGAAVVVVKNAFFGARSGKPAQVFNPALISRGQRAAAWVIAREFSDKCVLCFMGLLVFCAVFLTAGLEPAAEQLANIAYLALVTGVMIKLVKSFRGGKNDAGN